MSGDWDSLIGAHPTGGFSKIASALKKLDKAHAIHFKKEDGDYNQQAAKICDAAGDDPEKIVEAFNFAIRKRGYVSSILGFLKGNDSSEEYRSEDDYIPEETTSEVATDNEPPNIHNQEQESIPQEEESQDQDISQTDPMGNYCFFNRSLRNHEYLKKAPDWVRVMWDNLIMDAAWKDHEVEWCGRKLMLKRGQWVLSIRALAKERNQSERMVRYWLENFSKHKMIEYVALIKKLNSNEPWIVAGCVAGHVAGHVAGGILVTLLNFNKFQAKIDDLVAGRVAGIVAGIVALQKKGIKEGEQKKGDNPLNPPIKNKITSNEIFDIWDRERGILTAVAAREHSRVRSLVDHLNSLVGKTPQEHWTDIIHKARQCHSSHYCFMSPSFFSKDLEHINQLLRGLYDKTFERSGNGKNTMVERKGKGNASDFRATSESGGSRASRLANAYKTPDVSEVPGQPLDICTGTGEHIQSVEAVRVPGVEEEKGSH